MYFLASEGYGWTVILTIVPDTKGYWSSLFGISIRVYARREIGYNSVTLTLRM